MAASVFHSGFYGTAALGGDELPITKWEVQPTVELTPFKNSKSGGFILREATFQDCIVEIDVDFDFANNPFASPLNINVGAVLTNVKLYLHQSSAGSLDGLFWAFSSLIVDGTPQQLIVDGTITTKILCKGSGSFTYPT
jgi:hypothetical protein